MVKVNNFLFPTYFFILNMDKYFEVSLHLRRSFLETIGALIHVELGELIFIFQEEQVVFNVFGAMHHQNKNPKCFHFDVVEDLVEGVSQSESLLLPI